MKKNIGQKLALYPTPATVVGTVDEEGKVNWLLVAHVGIVAIQSYCSAFILLTTV